MKRLRIILVLGVLFLLSLPITNLIVGLPSNGLTAVKTGDPIADEAVASVGRKCANCHSEEVNLPFYAHLPIAKGIVEADIEAGTRYMDYRRAILSAENGKVNPVVLAKTEHVLDSGSMPPTKYMLLHWNGGLSDEEEGAIRAWISDTRRRHYATKGVAEQFADAAIQPLPEADSLGLDPEKVALGDTLFHDERLSKDDSISCASCHGLDQGGCDQRQYSEGVGKKIGNINSPTVFNSGLAFVQFWDGRAATLEEQADGPVNNPIEMASNWPEAIGELSRDTAFVEKFNRVYPAGLAEESIIDAIATFERSLLTSGGRFDRYLTGEEDALSDTEKAGYETFKSLGCATCHVGPLLGGCTFEEMGRKRDYFGDRGNEGEADQGRKNVTGDEADRHKFKVPTLRNVVHTYPYFHDGSTADLAEAVRVMARVELDEDPSEDEVAKIVEFLGTLTGTFRGRALE